MKPWPIEVAALLTKSAEKICLFCHQPLSLWKLCLFSALFWQAILLPPTAKLEWGCYYFQHRLLQQTLMLLVRTMQNLLAKSGLLPFHKHWACMLQVASPHLGFQKVLYQYSPRSRLG
jgi:hypothetical protein